MTGGPDLMVLAWDTSTMTTSAALVQWSPEEPQGRVIAETALDAATHSQNLLPALSGLLKRAALKISEVDLLAVGLGPGSFTGLRVGLAAAQGLSWGSAKPVAGLNSLEVMARQAAEILQDDRALIVPVMDARHQELFGALYRWSSAGLTLVGDYLAQPGPELERLIAQEAGARNLRPVLLGPGADLVSLTGVRRLPISYPSAVTLAGLAPQRRPAGRQLEPCYLRPPAIRSGGLK